ncbi:MAG: hypothetical protein IPN87_13770 [Saprospiraceae bacterium]|nr:hypothetical protein [Candidatus Brachybacter algidus]
MIKVPQTPETYSSERAFPLSIGRKANDEMVTPSLVERPMMINHIHMFIFSGV